jgi:hypothetical protein
MKVSDALDSRDREDSTDITDARGERGNANLMELNKLPPFDLSSPDFFEKADDGAREVGLLDDVPRNKENVGGSGRGCGVDMGASDQYWTSGEIIMSSTSKLSLSSGTDLVLSVDNEGRREDSSSPSSAEESHVEKELWSLVSMVENDAVDGIVIEVADAGGALARKYEDDKNGSHIELSTAVCITDSSVKTLAS